MLFKKPSLRTPDQIFLVVRNSGSTNMTPGYAVFHDYRQNTTAKNDGFSVRFAEDFWTDGIHPGLFAGVVAGRKIGPSGFGVVQVWGHIDTIFITGSNTVGGSMWTTMTVRSPTDADLATRVVWRAYGTNIDSTATGLFALFVQPSANVTVVGQCVVPTDGVYPWDTANDTYGTTYGTLTYTSSGTTRGFVRCL